MHRVAVILGVWAIAVVAALGLASALDSPVGAGEPDAAQPVAPDGALPDAAAATSPGTDAEVPEAAPAPPDDAVALPPFAMVLGRALPPDLAGLNPVRQAEVLRERAMSTGSPERLVELGSVLQLLGDVPSARFSYQSALTRDPGSIPARVGLAVVDGTTGADALPAAADRLATLASAHPGDQLIAFNQGWVALYRRDKDAAQAAFARTAELGPDTRLGRTARALLAASEQVEFDAGP